MVTKQIKRGITYLTMAASALCGTGCDGPSMIVEENSPRGGV